MVDNSKRGEHNVPESKTNRRRFLRGSAAVSGISALTGLAGCLGGGSDSDSTEGGENNANSNNAESQDTGFKWWDYAGTQSSRAEVMVRRRKDEWESNSDSNVELSLYGYGDITGSKWRSLFKQGRYPPVIDNFSIYNGPFIDQGFIKPMSEWIDWFSDDVKQAIEWTKPVLKEKNTGFEGDAYSLPWGVKSYPFVVRTDHWKEAGLSMDEFPPTGYDDLVEKAQILQEEGPGDWGYQICGQKYDVTDTDLPSWTIAEGGEDGLFITEDFDDVKIDNDTWINTFQKYVDIYKEYELSSPASPTASDEQNLARLMNGSGSMSTQNIGSHPTILKRAPELAENGNLKYGSLWGPGVLSFYSFSFTTVPDGVDSKKWEEKQKAAAKMIENQWFAPEKQEQNVNNLGMMPIRKDTWESTDAEGEMNLVEVESEHIEKSSLGWRNHPELTNLLYTVMPPHMQQALKGEISPDEALKTAAEEIRQKF